MDSIQLVGAGTLEKKKVIAQGTYGIIYTATTPDKCYEYAVKQSKTEKTIDFIGALKEVDFLAKLRNHPLFLKLVAISKGSPFGGNVEGSELDKVAYRDDNIYMIFEKADYDGKTFLVHHVTYDYIKLCMVQTLLAAEYMHGHGMLHRDLKPNNLLWFRQGESRFMKICDFGISKINCFQEPSNPKAMTPLYRAPELLFGSNTYDHKADMWSIGCIFYELLSKESFIDVDEDKAEILLTALLSKVSEIPSNELIKKMSLGLSSSIKINKSMQCKRVTLTEFLKNKIKPQEFDKSFGKLEDYLDMIEKLLMVDPNRRFDATQCLNHKCFTDFRKYIQEMRMAYPPFDLTFFNYKIKVSGRKERQYAIKFALSFYNDRTYNDSTRGLCYKYPWYSHRIIFQSIDIFDRFLEICKDTLSEETVELYYITCLYVSIKYFLTMPLPGTFSSLLPSKYKTCEGYVSYLKICENFEWYLLATCLKFNIYRPTLYETADFFDIILDEIKVSELLSGFCKYCIEDDNTHLFDLFAYILPTLSVCVPKYYTTCGIFQDSMTTTTVSPTTTSTEVSPGQENKSIRMVATSGPSSDKYSSVLPTSQALYVPIPGQQTMRGNLDMDIYKLEIPNK